MRLPMRGLGGGLLVGVALACTDMSGAAPGSPEGEWRYFGGDLAYTRYSPLAQIDAGNVARLEVIWRRRASDPRWNEEFPQLTSPRYLRSTPIMVDGVLYAPNALGLVEAFDPETGRTLWRQEPFERSVEALSTQSTRGVAYWTDGADARILAVRGENLYALDPATGEPVGSFGAGGRVELRAAHPEAFPFRWTSGPLVARDVVVIGGMRGGAGDFAPVKEREPEDINAYDVRTGRHLWTFHVVPREDEYGVDTWGAGSWEFSGDLGAWCCMSADEELGLVYVPLSAPSTAYYGGHRPGENLFSNTLVALDLATGERAWHFQSVRHDLWEYDLPSPPVLGELNVDGRRVPAVMQASKTGFLYVFDRVTGDPVWPIEDRPVPPSQVPGERAWPTQPFPTRPNPFDRQSLSEEDLLDLTPEIRARVLEYVEPYELAPIFTPPTLVSDEPGGHRGTLIAPGLWGAGNWNTGAFDPETGMYYAISHTLPSVYGLEEATDPDATMDYRLLETAPAHLDGLPIVKPPWGRITAIDLNAGEHAWMAPNGRGPVDHPLLQGLDLPPLGMPGRPAPLLTQTLLFLGEGSDAMPGIGEWMWGRFFRAYDKATGEVLWEVELDAGTTSAPMTYLFDGRQYIVVPIASRNHDPEWVAFALPRQEAGGVE